MSLLREIFERVYNEPDWKKLTPDQKKRMLKMQRAADDGDEVAMVAAASRDDSFKKFAGKTRRQGDSRASKKPEYKAQTNIWDKIKAGAGKVKDAASKDVVPRRDREFERVQKRSAKAQAAIDAENPGMTKRRKERSDASADKGDRLADRSMKKDEYKSIRSDDRQRKADTPRLVPLHQNDETKIRQLAKRLNPRQAQQLGDAIGAIIQGAQRANT